MRECIQRFAWLLSAQLTHIGGIRGVLLSQIFLTLLSLTFGLEIQGEIIRGYPCIRRLNQLYCPTPGNSYPKTNSTEDESRSRRVKREKIDMFIDENKALIRRMFGEYNLSPEDNMASSAYVRDHYETYDGHTVHTRSERSRTSYSTSSNKVDACESAVEIVTPYWASNSADPRKQRSATETAAANKSTSGTDSLPTILTTIVKESSWTGFSSLRAVSVDAPIPLPSELLPAPGQTKCGGFL